MKRPELVTRFCAAWGAGWLLLLIGLLYWDRRFYAGNHWWLFGTWVDRLVVEHHDKLAVATVAPLFVPILFVRSGATVALCFAACLEFPLMRELLVVAGD